MAGGSGSGRALETETTPADSLTDTQDVDDGLTVGEWVQVAQLDELVEAYLHGNTDAGLEIANRVLFGLGLLVAVD